jgi:hypothetical protein
MSNQNDFAVGPELVVGALTGYRYWQMVPGSGGLLRGHWGAEWPTEVMDAECRAHVERRLINEAEALELDKTEPDRVECTKVTEHTHWKDGTVTTEVVYHYYEVVMPGGHEVPGDDCKCGIYCGYEPRNVAGSWGTGSGYLFGVVRAEGKTKMGSHGFRTGKARIVALSLENVLDDNVDSTTIVDWYGKPVREDIYKDGVPVESYKKQVSEDLRARYAGVQLFDTDEQMVAAFPPDDITALGIENDGGHL